jgi:hypothetical protein
VPKTLAEAPEPDNEDTEHQDAAEDDDDTTDKNGSAASRLNAIVGAATFLSNADPNCKQQMVEIVKKEFYDFTGFVSTVIYVCYTCITCTTVSAHCVVCYVITISYVILSLYHHIYIYIITIYI